MAYFRSVLGGGSEVVKGRRWSRWKQCLEIDAGSRVRLITRRGRVGIRSELDLLDDVLRRRLLPVRMRVGRRDTEVLRRVVCELLDLVFAVE